MSEPNEAALLVCPCGPDDPCFCLPRPEAAARTVRQTWRFAESCLALGHVAALPLSTVQGAESNV